MKREILIFWKRLSHLCTKSHLCTVLFCHLCTEISHLCTIHHLCTNLYIDEILYIDDNLYIDETIPNREVKIYLGRAGVVKQTFAWFACLPICTKFKIFQFALLCLKALYHANYCAQIEQTFARFAYFLGAKSKHFLAQKQTFAWANISFFLSLFHFKYS